MVEAFQKTVLITGMNGMLGREIAAAFSDTFRVVGVDIVSGAQPPCEYIPGDVTDRRRMDWVFEQFRPRLVIHTAAMTDVDGCEQNPENAFAVNAAGTKNIAQCCRAFGSNMLYISTDYIFDGNTSRPYEVDDRARPVNVYGAAKWEGEQWVRRLLPEHLIVRTSWLFGRYGKNFVETIRRAANVQPQIRVVNDQCGCPTAVATLVESLKTLAEAVFMNAAPSVVPGTYHICNRGVCSWFDFAKEIVHCLGGAADVVPISSAATRRPAPRPAWSALSTRRFEQATGCTLPSWQDALRTYLYAGYQTEVTESWQHAR